MVYKNQQFTGTHSEWVTRLNASLPKDNPENWPMPEGEEPPVKVQPTPYVPTIEERREVQRQILKQERILRTSSPIDNIQVATPEDRENVQWAASSVQSIDWIMADNTVQTLSAAELQAVADAYPLRKMQMFAIYANLLEHLNQSSEPETIIWPEGS